MSKKKSCITIGDTVHNDKSQIKVLESIIKYISVLLNDSNVSNKLICKNELFIIYRT